VRILLLTAFLPHRTIGHGGATVLSHYVDYFRTRHELWVLSFYFHPAELALVDELRAKFAFFKAVPFPAGRLRLVLCRLRSLVGGRPLIVCCYDVPEMWREMETLLQKQAFDILQIDLAWTGQYVRLARDHDAKTALMELDVATRPLERKYENETSPIRRLWRGKEWRNMREYEPALCQKFDLVHAVSEEDRNALLSLNPDLKVSLFRFGVDEALFAIEPKEGNDHVVLFLGSFAHPPNVDAAEYLCHAIFPRVRERVPDASLYLVGGSPPASVIRLGEMPGVTVTGWVPDVGEYLALADVCVVPLRLGGGVKLKTLEMMAAGRAVVTTRVGCEGIAARSFKHLLVVESGEEFAAETSALLTDRARRRAMGAEARALIQKEHRWGTNLRQLEKDYEMLLQGRKTRKTAPSSS
jgi:glycosyltransferase involved in cell wall biosynthesis